MIGETGCFPNLFPAATARRALTGIACHIVKQNTAARSTAQTAPALPTDLAHSRASEHTPPTRGGLSPCPKGQDPRDKVTAPAHNLRGANRVPLTHAAWKGPSPLSPRARSRCRESPQRSPLPHNHHQGCRTQ